MSKTWILAEMKRGCRFMAEANLRRQRYSTFLPLEEVTARSGGRFVTTVRPLFPGYVFVAHDAGGSRWQTINSTYGIKRVVTFGDAPAIVPLSVVAQLMLRCDRDGKLLPPRLLSPGDRVRLTSGPFADFVATVQEIAPDRRIWVLLELMGVRTRLSAPVEGMRLVAQGAAGSSPSASS